MLPSGFIDQVARLPGVRRVAAARQLPLPIDPRQPPVTLIAREIGADPARVLPLTGAALPAAAGEVGVFVSEPAAAIHGWKPGQLIHLPPGRTSRPTVSCHPDHQELSDLGGGRCRIQPQH